MGKSSRRDDYFAVHCKPASDPEKYMLALKNSPYRFHRRMYEALKPMFSQILTQDQEARDKRKEQEKAIVDKLCNLPDHLNDIVNDVVLGLAAEEGKKKILIAR